MHVEMALRQVPRLGYKAPQNHRRLRVPYNPHLIPTVALLRNNLAGRITPLASTAWKASVLSYHAPPLRTYLGHSFQLDNVTTRVIKLVRPTLHLSTLPATSSIYIHTHTCPCVQRRCQHISPVELKMHVPLFGPFGV